MPKSYTGVSITVMATGRFAGRKERISQFLQGRFPGCEVHFEAPMYADSRIRVSGVVDRRPTASNDLTLIAHVERLLLGLERQLSRRS
jgi:hypothetical protein